MRATTIWQAYRRAHALSSLHLWDKKARRNELAFLARVEKIISEYDALMDDLRDGICPTIDDVMKARK